MRKIVMLTGLPAAGKTTFAKKLVLKGYKNICKDDLRNMLDFGYYSNDNERILLECRNQLIEYLMDERKNIVLSDCNFNPYHEKTIRKIIEQHNYFEGFGKNRYKLEVKLINTPLKECILRDSLRLNPVGKEVITKMYEQYLSN